MDLYLRVSHNISCNSNSIDCVFGGTVWRWILFVTSLTTAILDLHSLSFAILDLWWFHFQLAFCNVQSDRAARSGITGRNFLLLTMPLNTHTILLMMKLYCCSGLKPLWSVRWFFARKAIPRHPIIFFSFNCISTWLSSVQLPKGPAYCHGGHVFKTILLLDNSI